MDAMFATKSYATQGARDALKRFSFDLCEMQAMLDLCGKSGNTCKIEIIAMDQINSAFDQMLKSDAKYRFVIDVGTLK